MELPDPATLTAEQCTGDVYIRLSEATVAPVLFASSAYSRALTFNHMVLGNASEVPELLAADRAVQVAGKKALHCRHAPEAERAAADAELHAAYKNFREELGDMTWYTAGELRAAGGSDPYQHSQILDAFCRAPANQGRMDAYYLQIAGYNGEMADLAKRALFYIKQETIGVLMSFPDAETSNRIVQLATARLQVITLLVESTGWTLRDVMAANIRKLRGKGGRFAEKFEACRALHRNTKSEMEAHG